VSDDDPTPKTLADALAQVMRSGAPLNERLAAYAAHSRRLAPRVSEAYDALVQRLQAVERGEIGPAVGEPMPDFILPDQDGRLVTLDALLQQGPVVISINRGHWCPYCRLDLRALAAVHDDLERLGAQAVSIMPDRAQFTKQSIAANDVPFRILTDVDLSYSLLLDLVFWIGAELEALYQAAGLDLATYQGNGRSFLPMPAKFVVSQHGIVRARQIDADFRRRMEPQAVLAALEALRRD
jgi:peroxiredoxin